MALEPDARIELDIPAFVNAQLDAERRFCVFWRAKLTP
jgi:hypothetical protein